MVRNRVKSDPPKRRNYTAADMEKAVRLVMVDKYDVRRAARQADVPPSTLQNHLTKLRKGGTSMDVSFSKMGRKTALTEVEEKVLADLLKFCAGWGYLFTIADICTIVKQYLDSIPRTVEQFRDNRPGKDWASAFLKIRHPSLSSCIVINSKAQPNIDPENIDACISELRKKLNRHDPANAVSHIKTCPADETDKVKAKLPRRSVKVTASNKVTKNGRSKPGCRPRINIPAGKSLKNSECKVQKKTRRTAPNTRARVKRNSAAPPVLKN